MSRIILSRRLALLGLGLFLLAVAHPLRAADPKEVWAAIVAQEKKYDEAFNKGDAAALASLYLEEAQIFAPETEPVKGRQAIERYWGTSLKIGASAGTKTVSKPIEIEDHGGVAHEAGTYVNKKADGTIVEEGKYFVLWKKESGQWKIYRETWNEKRVAAK